MTEKINNLIINLYDVKAEKNSVIKKQMYEKASFLRDEERTIERNLYSMIFSGKVFNQIDLDNWLKSYLKEYYNIDYDSDISNFRETIREIKLKQLGIN
jgi:hypothetical protein